MPATSRTTSEPAARRHAYSIRVHNLGPSSASDVVITDTLPQRGHAVSMETTRGTSTATNSAEVTSSVHAPKLANNSETVVTDVVSGP